MPRRLTFRDDDTGQTVSFDWDGDTDPTEADLSEIFASTEEAVPPTESEIRRGQAEGQIGLAGNVIKGLRDRASGLESLKPTNILGALPGMAADMLAGPVRAGSALAGYDVPQYRDDPLSAIEDVSIAGSIPKALLRGARGIAGPASRRMFDAALADDLSTAAPSKTGLARAAMKDVAGGGGVNTGKLLARSVVPTAVNALKNNVALPAAAGLERFAQGGTRTGNPGLLAMLATLLQGRSSGEPEP